MLLPRIRKAVLEGRSNPQDRMVFASTLLDTFTTLTTSSLPDHVVAHFILPPLNQLQKTLGSVSFEHMETITVLTQEYTLRVQASQVPSEK